MVLIIISCITSSILFLVGAAYYYKTKNLECNESIAIDSDFGKIFSFIGDFKNYPQWHPWIYADKNIKVKINGKGDQTNDTIEWNGPIVASGDITHKSIINEYSVTQIVNIQIPFKLRFTCEWHLTQYNIGAIEVSCRIKTKTNPIHWIIKAKIESLLKLQIRKGLQMLKDLAEKDQFYSEILDIDIINMPNQHIWAKKGKTTFVKMSSSLNLTFNEIIKYSFLNKVKYSHFITIYDKLNLDQTDIQFYAGIILEKKLAEKSQEMQYLNLPPNKSIRIIYKGDLKHLGNAWTTIHTYARRHKHKLDKQKKPYQIYKTNPHLQSDYKDLITEIYLPIK